MYHDLTILIALILYLIAFACLYVSITRHSQGLRRASIISCFVGAAMHPEH